MEGLHVLDSGSGRVVVLVHGTMDRAGGLARVGRHLRHRRVLRYDRRGYAGSASAGPGTLDQHADDLVALLERIGRAAEAPPVVAGHSFGGLVALVAARRAPGLVGAVGAYEPPTPWHPAWPPGIERWRGDPSTAVDTVIEHAVGAERWARAPQALRAVRRLEGEAMLTEMRSIVDAPGDGVPEGLGPVGVPVSLAYGSASGPYAAEGLAALAARLDVGALVRLEGPAHRAPVTHAAVLAGWVDGLVDRASVHAGVAP